MAGVLIRDATIADAGAIALVNIDCWRETYAGILPDDYLRLLSWEEATENWKKMWHDEKSPWKVFVAEEDGLIKGFVNIGKSRQPTLSFDGKLYPIGELYSIYLLREIQGRGIGKKLFKKAHNSLKLNGIKDMYLWVFKDNPAIGFYQYMGGEECSRRIRDIGGVSVEEVSMVWKKLIWG